jgi:hypothetical protein
MAAYCLKTDGTIRYLQLEYTDVNDVKPQDIDPTYTDDSLYMCAVGNDGFFLFHLDNDLNLTHTTLPINTAIRKFFPKSSFVGDALFVKTNPLGDILVQENFDLEKELSKYELYSKKSLMENGFFYFFVKK